MSRQRCCEAACPEHPTLLNEAMDVVRRAGTAARAIAWLAVRSVVSR